MQLIPDDRSAKQSAPLSYLVLWGTGVIVDIGMLSQVIGAIIPPGRAGELVRARLGYCLYDTTTAPAVGDVIGVRGNFKLADRFRGDREGRIGYTRKMSP